MAPLKGPLLQLRGQRVRVISNDGREYVGWLEKIDYNGGDVILRDAETDGEAIDPAYVRAPKSVDGIDVESRIEEASVGMLEPSPYHVREFEASENRQYIDTVREDGWAGSYPVVRDAGRDLEIVEGHKRLWVAGQAGLETHPVEVVQCSSWDAAETFVAGHLPDERHVEDGVVADGRYGNRETAAAIQTLVDHWGAPRACGVDRVAWNVDRLGLDLKDPDTEVLEQ